MSGLQPNLLALPLVLSKYFHHLPPWGLITMTLFLSYPEHTYVMTWSLGRHQDISLPVLLASFPNSRSKG